MAEEGKAGEGKCRLRQVEGNRKGRRGDDGEGKGGVGGN
jgi:hypothetical protein